MNRNIAIWIFWSLLVLARLAHADDDKSDKAEAAATNSVLAGHSIHGEAFNEGPRQKAYLMEGMGDVNFLITTKDALAQKFFNQGISQLHGFWYFEAERTFRQVAALDTNCAMAYWGMAMANVNNEKRAKEFIKRAAELKCHADRREAMWIDAWADFYKEQKKEEPRKDEKKEEPNYKRKEESTPQKQRLRDLVRSLESIVHEFPDDIEAKAFLVLQIWRNTGELPITSQEALEALASQVLAVAPMHPIHHYRIHLWNSEKDQRALSSAARCGQSLPGIAHMWHMPGHTFTKLHRYADAAWQQEAAVRVDHAHMIRDRVLPDQIHNYAHNNDWLVENFSYIGRVHDALALVKNMIEIPRHPHFNSLTNQSGSAYFGRKRLCEVVLGYELWHELIALSDTVYLEPTDLPREQARRLHALGLAWFNQGDAEKSKAQINGLESVLKKVREERQAAAEAAEAKARKEKQPADKVAKAMADAMQSFNERLEPIESAIAELKGCEFIAEKEMEKANEQFDQVKKIPKERLARLYSLAGDHDHAETLAREAIESAPNQVQVLANYVEVLYRGGKTNEATDAFNKLQTLSIDLDLEAPIFQRLTQIAPELNLAADWRIKAPTAPDVGVRPSLDQLGPFRWHPSPAPDWSLPNTEGNLLSLSQYRGKPVVVIFYLGHGCAHCLEQLQAFAPVTREFADAGISLVAISTDSVEGLKKTAEKNKAVLGFPIVSDKELATFKAYRAFDDFEKTPLHGAFLIDGDGLVRWQDVNYQPFKEARFLLEECKRLLGQPKPQLVLQAPLK